MTWTCFGSLVSWCTWVPLLWPCHMTPACFYYNTNSLICCIHLSRSGESGAGKTESTKLLLRHIMELCKANSQLEQQILQVRPRQMHPHLNTATRFAQIWTAMRHDLPSAFRWSGVWFTHRKLKLSPTRVCVCVKGTCVVTDIFKWWVYEWGVFNLFVIMCFGRA